MSWKVGAFLVLISTFAAGIVRAQSFTLSASTPGGGTISLSPPGGTYASNTVVTLTAIPGDGWTFMQWLDDASGTNTNTTVAMTRNMSVQAVFGTTVKYINADSNLASVALNPSGGFYAYGTTIQMSSIPSSNRFFLIWFNTGVTNPNPTLNPYPYVLTNSSKVLTCQFITLGVSQKSLAAVPVGFGTVTTSPLSNAYSIGDHVSVIAIPAAGQDFLGWSGDASGTNNPLSVTMSQSRVIYASFTRRSTLSFRPLNERSLDEGFQLTLSGEIGATYRLDGASSLGNWAPIATNSNSFGILQFIDSRSATNGLQFYRGVQESP